MSAVDQTIYFDDPKRQGNCLSACVATFLECPLDEVPHFAEFLPDDKSAWWYLLIGFMAGHGYWAYELESVEDADPGERVFVMGPSPRGVMHQVIYRDGELFHDPHPSRTGVTEVREVLSWRPMRHDHQPTPAHAACSAADLLAGLRATSEADAKVRESRLLGGGS